MPASKELVDVKLRIPGDLADFLDERLAELPEFRGRAQLVLHYLRQVRQKHHHSVSQSRFRQRRQDHSIGGAKVG